MLQPATRLTLRDRGATPIAGVGPFSGVDIRAIRKHYLLRHAVLARYLNVTAGYASQLVCGTKRPAEPALVPLSVIRRKDMNDFVIFSGP